MRNGTRPDHTLQPTGSRPARRTFVLFALAKINSPKIVQVAYLALEAAQSPDLELRDTATRALGKFAESIPPSHLSEEMRRHFIQRLQANLADPNSGIAPRRYVAWGNWLDVDI